MAEKAGSDTENSDAEGGERESADDAGNTERETAYNADMKKEAERIIEEIYRSPAKLAMLQIQDVFLLGSEARINVPGVAEGNWTWRVPGGSIDEAFPDAADRADWFRRLTEETGR